MKQSKIYGTIIILATLGMIITMIFHPTGKDILNQPEDIAQKYSHINIAVHALAIASLGILYWAFWQGSNLFGSPKLLINLGLISFGIGTVCGINAAVINGFVAPNLLQKINEAEPVKRELLQMILANNFELNQAFTKVYVISTAFAIIVWSICLWKNKNNFSKITAVVGFIISIFCFISILAGHIKLDVHGFGLIVFLQAIWTILTAIYVIKSEKNLSDEAV